MKRDNSLVTLSGVARGGGDGGGPPRAAKLRLSPKFRKGEKYFEGEEF